jgi:RimJ/RimL family protein N-acetyltransferase
LESLASGGALLATDAETERVIGSSRFFGYSEEAGEVEIGWTFLARSHWGGRYNGELKQLMLRHVTRIVGVREPESDTQGRLVHRIHRAQPGG